MSVIDKATDLPIFEGEVLYTKPQYEATPSGDSIEFVRALRVCFPDTVQTIDEGIDLTNRHFTLLKKQDYTLSGTHGV